MDRAGREISVKYRNIDKSKKDAPAVQALSMASTSSKFIFGLVFYLKKRKNTPIFLEMILKILKSILPGLP